MAQHRQKKRRWPLVVVILAVLAIVAAPLLHLRQMERQADSELRAFIAQLDETDPGWRLSDIEAARPRLPDEDNAALMVIAAQAKIPRGWAYGLFEDWDNNPRSLPPPVQLNDWQIAKIEKEIALAKAVLPEARKLKNHPEGRYSVNWTADWMTTNLGIFYDLQSVVDLLEYDVFLLAQEKKSEQAWQSCESIFRISTSMGNADSRTIFLRRNAIRSTAVVMMERVLAQGEVDDAALAHVQKLLEDDLQEPILWMGLRGERAGMHRFFLALEDGLVSYDQIDRWWNSTPLTEYAYYSLPTGAKKNSHTWILRYLTKGIEAAKLPPADKLKRFAEIDEEFKVPKYKGGMRICQPDKTPNIPYPASILYTEVAAYAHVDICFQTHARCAICAFACERYRLKHNHWPSGLQELVKENLIAEVPADPFDGEPLRYRQSPNGIVIYSIGPDHWKSYNGEALDNLDFNEARLEFRLWNVEQRRAPPRPVKKKTEEPAVEIFHPLCQ